MNRKMEKPDWIDDITKLVSTLERVRRGKDLDAESEAIRDKIIASKGHLIHKLKAKDSTGRWAYYFVLVEPYRERDFMATLEGDGMIELDDFGRVIASCYGETPNDETKSFLKEKYGFEV